MGLEGVELVMEVEDHFGITIPDGEAGRVRTVGDLVALIHERISAAQVAYCPSLAAFFSLRTAVRDLTGNDSLRLRPRHAVGDVLTSPQRRLFWDRLALSLGTAPSGLERPRFLRRLLIVSALGLFLIAVVAALAIDITMLPLTLALAVVTICVLLRSTVPFRTEPPDGWATFGDITRKLVGKTVATKQLDLCTPEDVFKELQPIIVEVLGVKPNEVAPSARFIEDLGAG